jgi:hypothetical protein
MALRGLSGPQSGEQRYGRAASFEAARAEFEAAWREYLPKRSEADFGEWRHRAAPASGGVGIEVAPRNTGILDASLGGLPSQASRCIVLAGPEIKRQRQGAIHEQETSQASHSAGDDAKDGANR